MSRLNLQQFVDWKRNVWRQIVQWKNMFVAQQVIFRVLMWLPPFGFLRGVFLDSVPPLTGIMELLNVIGLLSALLLSAATTHPSWASYEEMEAADERFAEGGIWSCDYAYGHGNLWRLFGVMRFSNVLQRLMTSAMSLLGVSLFGVIITYSSLATLGRDLQRPTKKQLRVWWFGGGRLVILIVLLASILGSIFFFVVIDSYILVAFPDQYLEETCARGEEGNFRIFHGGSIDAMKGSPAGWYGASMIVTCAMGMPVMMIILGWAAYRSTNCEESVVKPLRDDGASMEELAATLDKAGLPLELLKSFREDDSLLLSHEMERAGISSPAMRLQIIRSLRQ